MKNIDVLYFIEHPGREMDVALAIKHQLSGECEIVIKSLIYDAAWVLLSYSPKVVVTPSNSFSKGSVARMFYQVYGNNIGYINLNFEQFISKANEGLKIPSHEASRNYQYHFCWNKNFLELLKGGGVHHTLLKLTGRPYESIIKQRYLTNKEGIKNVLAKKHSLPVGKHWVFIAMTDGMAFAKKSQVKSFIKSGADPELTKLGMSYVKNTSNDLFAWLPLVAENCKEFQFILRPHPSVSVSQYVDLLPKGPQGKMSNVLITKEETALQWLASSSILVTNLSTLCVDARNLNTPIAILKHGGGPPEHWINSNLGSGERSFSNASEFASCVRSMSDFRVNPVFNPTKREGSAIEKTGKELLKVLAEFDKVRPRFFAIFLSIMSNFKRFFGSVIRLILMKIGLGFLVKRGIQEDYFDGKFISDKYREYTRSETFFK